MTVIEAIAPDPVHVGDTEEFTAAVDTWDDNIPTYCPVFVKTDDPTNTFTGQYLRREQLIKAIVRGTAPPKSEGTWKLTFQDDTNHDGKSDRIVIDSAKKATFD